MIKLTKVQKINHLFLKRDDTYYAAGGYGGKARVIYHLIKETSKNIVTAGDRHSLQMETTATIAKNLNKHLIIVCPTGELGPELKKAKQLGSKIVQVKMGYTNVLIANARKIAQAENRTYIPWGLECAKTIKLTSQQVDNIPIKRIKRLVVPVGSGMQLCGILHGLIRRLKVHIPILAIWVGADPTKRLNKFAPSEWSLFTTLVKSTLPYNKPSKQTKINGIELDAYYEAKCIEHIKDDDCLWIVANRNNEGI